MTIDPIADMLTRMRNALNVKHKNVSIPVSKTKLAITELLLNEGYIASYKVEGEGIQSSIVIEFKDNNVIKGLKRISKPGLRIYASVEDLPRVINGLGKFVWPERAFEIISLSWISGLIFMSCNLKCGNSKLLKIKHLSKFFKRYFHLF